MKDNNYSKWLEELKSKVDFVGIVSRYVTLQQRGRNYWGCCPFHHEKTPSFSVDPYEGFFHCFGCKEGGDVIKFVEKIENCSFPDAVAMLAKSCNMEVPVFHQDESVIEKKKEKDRLLSLMKLASEHYHKNIYFSDAKKAQDYIKLRGFTRRELDDFYLGYSKNYTEIISFMKENGFSEEEMLKAGLIQKGDNGKLYDTQAGRLVFPIYNSYNDCIAFTSRVLEKTDYAKYKNTPESPIFSKGKTVFAINLVKKYKNEIGLKNIIIVEGQIDVIAMHKAGFKNTVACLGTAFTADHVRELKRFSDNIILCFDGDGAGVKATIRAIEILRTSGMDIKIVSLPDGKDPDEILKEKGKEFLQKQIENAKPVMDFYIDYELKNYDISKADEKGKFIKVCLEHLKKLNLSSMQEPYLAKIRDMTNVPIDVLRRDLGFVDETTKKVQLKSDEKENITPVRENSNEKATKFILASLLHKKEYCRPNINYRKLILGREYIFDIIDSKLPISSIFDRYDVEKDALLSDLIYYDFSQFDMNAERYFDECLHLKAEEILKSQKDEVTLKFKNCEDLAERRKLLEKLAEINKKLLDKNLEEFND